MIVIERYGKAVGKMVIFNDKPVAKRIGVAKGKFRSPANLSNYSFSVNFMK